MTSPALPIRTPRLTLRPHTADDAGWMHTLFSREDVAQYLPYEPWTPEFTATKLAEHLKKDGLENETGGLTLAVELTPRGGARGGSSAYRAGAALVHKPRTRHRRNGLGL